MATTKKKGTTGRKKTAARAAKRSARRQPMSEEQMRAAGPAAASPGEHHRRLEPIIGTFKAKTTMVMEPGVPPEVSEGTSEQRWVLGGRYVEQRYRGSAMGMPFEGLGYTGYDNIQKKYVGTWMDTFSTGIMHSSGAGRPTKSAMDFDAQAFDCLTNKPIRFETKMRIKDENCHTFEMWTKARNGKRFRTMFIEFTRA